MFSKATLPLVLTTLVLSAGVMLTGCGTSSGGPNGSKHQTATGVSESGYPGGEPKDSGSPALASSSEQQHSDAGKPKVTKEEAGEAPVAK